MFEVIRNPAFLALMEEARTKLTPSVSELRLDHPEERHFSARVSPLSYREKELAGFVVILHDITQLKKLEQTRKDFVANISHEIKTPITAIKGFADTLLEGALQDTEHAEKFLKIIKVEQRADQQPRGRPHDDFQDRAGRRHPGEITRSIFRMRWNMC